MNINDIYSFLIEDIGYVTNGEASWIYHEIPYQQDIEARLVRFLRHLYYYKIKYWKAGFCSGKQLYSPNKPCIDATNYISKSCFPKELCIPLYMQYQIKKEDWNKIIWYIKKYNIRLFNKNLENLKQFISNSCY